MKAAVRRHGAALAGLIGVTTAATLWNLRSILDQWSTAVPVRLDNRFQAWVIHWVQGALMGEHPLYDAATFAPASASLTFSDHLIGLGLILLPLRWLGLSPAAVFNTGIVLGTVTSALSAYLLGFVLTLGPVPWLVTRHVNLVWRGGLAIVVALIWVLADRAGRRRQWSAWPSDRWLLVALGLVVAWQGLVSFFYAMLVLIVAVIAVAVRRRDLRERWRGLVLAVGLGTVGFVPSYVPYLVTRSRQAGFGWTLEQVAPLRAAPQIVEEANLVWGGLLGRPLFGSDGLHAFPGLTLLLLVVCGLALAGVWSRQDGSRAVPVLGVVLVVVGALGALGPGWGRTTGWTPFALAFRFVPGFSALRESGRFVLVVLLGAAVLAAIAVAAGAARIERRAASNGTPLRSSVIAVGAIAAVLVTGLVVEGAAGARDVTPAVPHAVDELLAELPEEGGVVYLPVGYANLADFDAQEAFVIRGTAHDRRMVNGFAGFYPESARVLAHRLEDLPDADALDCLAAYDIRFVVISAALQSGPWAALTDPANAAPLELVEEVDGELLYRVPDRKVARGACPLPAVD
jgi:hypothetical protein